MSVHMMKSIESKYQTIIKDDLAMFGYDLESWCDY